jgi:Polysaccharide pyruvyl transferase
MPRICLFDPSITSREGAPTGNLGDLIIRQAVVRELTATLPGWDWFSIPTQLPLTADEFERAVESDLLVIGGTNLLSSHMQQYRQWQIGPEEAMRLKRVVLMGAGWWQYQDAPDPYTQSVLRGALSPRLPQSVRDGYTARKLHLLGFRNVINTGCPTMWGLTPDVLRAAPTTKADDVLLMLTDYNKNRPVDRQLLDLLFSQYKRVYFWPQGSGDARYLGEFAKPLIMLDRSLEALEQLLQQKDPIDCIGTRLHGGVRCMERGRRTVILGIDNRAAEIAADTGLAVIPRNELETLRGWIAGSGPVELTIPTDAVSRWKQELSAAMSMPERINRAA